MGEMINLMSIDANRLMELWHYFYLMCFSPLRIVVVLVGLYWVTGFAFFAGLAVSVLLMPFTVLIYIIGRRFQVKLTKNRDKRLKMINSIINGIKVM